MAAKSEPSSQSPVGTRLITASVNLSHSCKPAVIPERVQPGSTLFKGYKICAFPDSLDAQTPAIGYMPGHLTWKFGERLKTLGFEIVNDGISGAVHRDRQLITGDSPLAGNALGKLAAETLLKEVTA